jgi:2-polyprenyl-6-methoxyphenol hydroxylase-like FAD-dependent oxidoreductase
LIHHLLCLGGGPAGLSLAIGLKRKGFQNLIVYEREKSKKRSLDSFVVEI